MQVDIPDDLANFFEEWAPKFGKPNGRDVIVHLLDEYRTKKRKPFQIRNAGETYGTGPRKK